MFQIDNSSAVNQLPSPSQAGTAGYFSDGDPATGQAATILPAEFMNMLMMELMNVVTGAGVTPDKTKNNQVLSAIQALILSQFSGSIGGNGYIKLPPVGGKALILQYVIGAWDPAAATEPTQTLTFPLAFPNAFLSAQVSGEIASASVSADCWYQHYGATLTQIGIQRQSSTSAGVSVQTRPHVFAIGY